MTAPLSPWPFVAASCGLLLFMLIVLGIVKCVACSHQFSLLWCRPQYESVCRAARRFFSCRFCEEKMSARDFESAHPLSQCASTEENEIGRALDDGEEETSETQ